MNNVKQEQTHLAKLAANYPDKRFGKLYRLICQPAWLMSALDAIRANKGFNTPGTDGVRGEDLDQHRIEQLAEKLRSGEAAQRNVSPDPCQTDIYTKALRQASPVRLALGGR